MRNIVILSTSFVLFLCAGISISSTITGPIINPATGNSYILLAEANWTSSEAEAITLGGHLVTINDVAENDWVYDTFAFYGGVERDIWLGLNDAASEGDFVWASAEPVTFTNFGAGEPNNGAPLPPPASENYVFMLAQPFLPINAREWNDAPDVVAGIYGVVEIVNPIPLPSAIILFGSGLIGLAGFNLKRKDIKINICSNKCVS